jgi:hypothetical protein
MAAIVHSSAVRFPKIGHLPGSRTGPKDRTVDRTLSQRLTLHCQPGDRVLVEEKLDGSCVGILQKEKRLHAIGRDGKDCALSRNEGRRRFAAWVDAHPIGFLDEGEVLWGEWLALAHGTRYQLPHGPFVAFDLMDRGGTRLGRDLVEARVGRRLPRPHLLHDGGSLSVVSALERLGDHGHHGAIDPAEGVVYRLERGGRLVTLAKWVRSGKRDGIFLADHSGGDHVWNDWAEPVE